MDVLLCLHVGATMVALATLWFAGGKVIEYALDVAETFEVTTFFVGFVVLAMAADLPEITVAITAALHGVSEMSVGDIIGANFSDVSLVTGIATMFAGTIDVAHQERLRLLGLISSATLVMLAAFFIEPLVPWHGATLILLYLFSIFLVWKTHTKKEKRTIYHKHLHNNTTKGQEANNRFEKWALVGKLGFFLGLVLTSSSVIVYLTEAIAQQCHIPLETAGATILAIGTSLPELSLSLNALKRKEYALALGPTLGTVLEQSTLVLGLLAIFSKKPVNMQAVQGTAVFMFIAFLIVFCSLLIKKCIKRNVGIVLLLLFCWYIAYHYC